MILKTLGKLLIFGFIVAACSNPSSSTDVPASGASVSANGLALMAEEGSVSVWAAETDGKTAQDVLAAIQANSKQICSDLQTECQFPVVVEVYPDQASFDEHVMNPEMRGFFAISGFSHTIQMVSPASPAPHKISYKDGVAVAVHEFVHLALDEVDPDMPIWLDEGTAVYVSPHKLYNTACQIAFPFEMIPPFQQLADNYNGIQAPDLFAYTAVDFIVHEYGIDKLNELLRSPEDLEDVLEISIETFEKDWHRFIRMQYHNYISKAVPVLGIACIMFLAFGAVIAIRLVQRKRK